MNKSTYKFNARQLRWELWEHLVAEQTKLFIDYARTEIKRIGARFEAHYSANNLDRTGNLLDSLVWGVSFNGKLQDYGFYREQTASSFSTLHEWSTVTWQDNKGHYTDEGQKIKYQTMKGSEFMPEVWGHELAERYAHKYGNNGSKGWKIFFAILAPYWGYWEKGFSMVHGYGKGRTFEKAAIMSESFDEVKIDLKPVKVRFRVSVAKYTNVSLAKTMKRNA